jgi:hypothetical protein
MIRRMDGRPATRLQLRKYVLLRERVAEQWNLKPECDECGLATCNGCEPVSLPLPVIHWCVRCGDSRVTSENAWCLPCARNVA